MPGPSERRRMPRAELMVCVDLESPAGPRRSGVTQDISSGGIFVATPDLLDPGERLHVRFSIPDASPIEVDAEVRWVRRSPGRNRLDGSSGMGLSFLEMQGRASEIIDSFVSRHVIGRPV